MIIRCEKCSTTYHLEEKKIEPFGSKVRCTRCGHIFWAEAPSFSETLDSQKLNPDQGPFLAVEEEEKKVAMQMRPVSKTLWTLVTVGILILIALGARFFYVQYLHPNWSMGDICSKVLFLPVDPEGFQKISLVNIKKYFKENEKIGRFFVIEGEIKNGYPTIRQKIRIRGALKTAENKVAASREVYAGWTMTPQELDTLSLEEIDRLHSTQPERFSSNARVLPGKTLPFMILFPPLPPGSTQVSIEVVGSQKNQSISFLNLFLG